MATVYVIARYLPFEGYDEPRAAFSSREAAQAEADKLGAGDNYSEWEVFELPLELPITWGLDSFDAAE